MFPALSTCSPLFCYPVSPSTWKHVFLLGFVLYYTFNFKMSNWFRFNISRLYKPIHLLTAYRSEVQTELLSTWIAEQAPKVCQLAAYSLSTYGHIHIVIWKAQPSAYIAICSLHIEHTSETRHHKYKFMNSRYRTKRFLRTSQGSINLWLTMLDLQKTHIN